MSVIKEGYAVCSKCGGRTPIKVYSSINVSENPELKDKVRDGSLFLWQCPSCGQVNLARYETLYHDPAGKLMVWLIPDGQVSETQMAAITRHTRAMGGYTLRRVEDMGSLMEKVLIHDAGLDDTVVEMCKFVTGMEMGKDIQFRFYRVEGEGDDRMITLMFPDRDRMSGVKIGWNVYSDCTGILERNPDVKPDEGFAKVDAAWLSSIMK